MAYTSKDWQQRHSDRVDISSMLTHLTREAIVDGVAMSAVAVLVKILRDQRILGSDTSSGFIVGGRRAVCFQDAPLLGIAQNVRFEQRMSPAGGRVRYDAVGVAFPKRYAFGRGARPVFYEDTETARGMLPPKEYWRIVSLNLASDDGIVDWMHEREWRAPDGFSFDRRACGVVLSGTPSYREFMRLAPDLASEIAGISLLAHSVA